MRAFLVIAATMAIAGLAIYWKLAGHTTGRRRGIAVFILLLTALTWLQLWAVTPPNPSQLVPGWIIAPLVFSAIPYLLDRKRVSAQSRGFPSDPPRPQSIYNSHRSWRPTKKR